MIKFFVRSTALCGLLIAVLAACDMTALPDPPTPTLESTVDTPLEVTDAVVTPSPQFTQPATPLPPLLESPTPSYTPGPPTETPTPTPTLGPIEYLIQPNDTFYYVLRQNGLDFMAEAEVLSLNPNIINRDRLPVGVTILLPRPTATETPVGYDQTVTALPPTQPIPDMIAPDALVAEVAVNAGETIIGVALRNDTTLVILATLNPDLGWFNCDFSNPSGGSGCNVSLIEGQLVNVPQPTPTPTVSPTISGNETPTSVPTYAQPAYVFPADHVSISPRTFTLQWISQGVLAPNEYYLVQVEDLTSGAQHVDVTKSTSYELPASLIPTDGQPHQMRWRVSIATPNEIGVYRIISGGENWRNFQWMSR